MAVGDKCIGRLTLETKQIDDAVKHVNEKLKELGVGVKVDLSKKVAAEVKKQLDDVLKEIKSYETKMGSAVDKVISNATAKAGKKIDDSVIKQATKDLQEYYKWLTMAEKARGSGDLSGEDIYRKRADSIREANAEMFKNAEATKAVADAETKYQQALARANELTMNRQQKTAVKEKEQAVKEYIKALQEWYKAETDLNKELLSGNLQKGTSEYAETREQVDLLGTKAREAGKKLADLGVDANEATSGVKSLQQAAKELSETEDKLTNPQVDMSSKVKEAETAYKNLTTAVRNYNIEKKTGNTDRQDMWAQEAASQMQVLTNLEKEIGELNVDENIRQRILSYVEQGRTAQAGMTAETGNTSAKTGELESQVKGLATRYLSLMAVIRAISSLMNNMVDYVSEYSQKMNEIQMITLKTDDEVARLAETYRNLAADMNVSSLDMADAAIYFTRQGLAAGEIEKRLKNVTMYAKAANVEFQDASEIITAVVNSMGLVEEEAKDGRNAAQRVADVFLEIGDHAATSGQEIGEAMQKAAASAGAFGVSMEWLAAYIAAVSETTRQEARTIGTAFNTIIARLHQIKQTGYNSEDETKVNDIAKALSKIDIVLMDQEGNWRDMEDILVEVAAKWGELDGKTKSYIATTMAGVKQQNVFLALMNDMSKGTENGSRAFELHERALNSNGVAAEKYGVYLDSVTAAQERLTIAQEKFYALLDENIIKNWYDMMAGIINFFTEATDKANGLNIVIPVLIGGIWLLIAAVNSLGAAAAAAGGMFALLEAHPIILTITAVTAGIIALSAATNGLSTEADRMKERFDLASQVFSESNRRISSYIETQRELSEMIEDVGEETPMTSEKIEEYNDLLEQLKKVSPEAADAVERLKSGMLGQKEAAEILNKEIEEVIKKEQKLSKMSLINKYSNWKPGGTSEESGFMSRFANWGQAFNSASIDSKAFEDGLKYYYEHDVLPRRQEGLEIGEQGTPYLTKEVIDEIDKQVQNAKNQNKEADWGIIGSIIWSRFVGSTADSLPDAIKEEADAAINEVMTSLGSTLNDVDAGAVRKQLMNAIFGEDGELSTEEYKNIGANIIKFLNGFDFDNIDQFGAIEYIGDRFLGHYFDLIFGEQLAQLKNDPEYDVISNYISQAVSELIESGFSDTDIASVLEGLDLRNWGSAVGVMKQKLRDEIKKNAGVDNLGISILNPETGGTALDQMMWLDLDAAMLKYINDLVVGGVAFSDIQRAMYESEGSADKFKEKLEELSGIKFGEEVEDQVYSLQNSLKEINSSIKDIKALDAAIKDIQENKDDFNVGDMLGLVEAHPEILTVIDDSEELLKVLKKIREEASNNQRAEYRKMIMNAAPTGEYAAGGFETMQAVRDSLAEESDIAAFDAAVERMITQWLKANEDAKKVAKEAKEEAEEAKKSFDDAIKEVETLDKMISKLQDNKKIDFSDIISLAKTHPEIMNFIDDADSLIAALERLKAAEMEVAQQDLRNIMLTNEDWFKESEYYDGIHKNLTEYLNDLEATGGDWQAVLDHVDETAKKMTEGSDAASTAAETWLEAQMKIAEINDQVNWAKANNFEDQIKQLQTAVDTGGIEAALELYNSWDNAMQQAVGTEYPNFVLMLTKASGKIKEQGEATADLTEETEAFSSALKTATKLNDVKYFKESAKAIKQLAEGTISASDAYDVYTKDLNKVTKAYEDILDVQAKMEYNAKEVNKDNQQAIDAADVNNLATLLGITTDEILADFPSAVDMFDELIGRTGELQDVINMLNDTAFIRITGTSDADFSAIQAGLISVENLADEAVQKLLATGQWTTEVLDLPQTAAIWHPGDPKKGGGYWSYDTVEAGATILKPTGNNPFKGASTVSKKADTKQKKSGGGGGGSKKDSDTSHNTKKTETEVERMLDLMSQVNAIQQSQQNYYQSQQKYYQQTGQLQGVIAYMQKEKEVLEGQNGTLDANIKKIEQYMEAKKAEISTMSTEDEKYEEVADDLDKLQKAHQNYTKQLIDNKTAIEALNEQMDEQRKKIRQMEIDLRNLVLKAIEDREKKRVDMLNAEIEMENKILDLIKKRYERERDDIIRTTELKIDALNKEKSLLDEQLRIRKEQAEAEDKQLKLHELELKYQRILADPTRSKEAKSIKSEIDALRKEMAWDLAEEEVKSQQDSIEQQIESLEDYKEYIENYYEDLFEHPQKLIEEMRSIIMGTQEEIINWLKDNDEEYKNSSENTQLTMVTSWEETYNEMKGILKTYWEEVEEIIAQGDEYIIEFLKQNSADYAAAGKLQAEAYVDEWKKQLSDLHKAYQQVATSVASNYATIQKATSSAGSSSNSSSSGSNGSSSSSNKNNNDTSTQSNKKYHVHGTDPYGRQTIYGVSYDTRAAAQSALNKGQQMGWKDLYISYYKRGGLASYTGPAWLDGTPQEPERILSPYQTKLFETMVETLERMSTISVSNMPNMGDIQTSGGNPVSVGDIIVNVDNLDTDDDYEELARKVGEVLMEEIGRTAVIGGLRIRSV